MTRRDQEEAEQAAYEEYMQAMYDEQCRLQQLDDEHEWLRAEVKRLTAENEALRGERAAVVAALRSASNRGPMGLSLVDLDSIADAIERGEHRAGGAR